MNRHLVGWMGLLAVFGCGDPDTTSSDPGPTGSDTGDSPTTDTDPGTDTDIPTAPPTHPVACSPLPPPTGPVVEVDPSQDADLQAVLDAAAPGSTIRFAAGTYILAGHPLVIAVDDLTLVSATGNRDDVVLDGAWGATDLLTVAASGVTIASMTLTRGVLDLVAVDPADASLTGVVLHDLALKDFGRLGIEVRSGDDRYADDGAITCSHVLLDDDGRDRVHNCAVGGIELSSARNWKVTDNEVEGLWCPEGPAANPGIFAHGGTRELLVARNRVWDAGRGIRIGEGTEGGRTYEDAPCAGAVAQDYGSSILNNMIAADGDGIVSSPGGVITGLGLESTCEVTASHNSIQSGVTPSLGCIDHRYGGTTGTLANNLCQHGILRSENSLIDSIGNVETVPDSVWLQPRLGDLHLVPSAQLAIGMADPTVALPDDLDLQPRDADPDAGADELDL